MTEQVSHGAGSRRPVYSGNRKVRGLHERTLANGTTVYEAGYGLTARIRWWCSMRAARPTPCTS
jgi:hypothetical protein